MAVFLELKCLPIILDSCKGFISSKCYVVTYAQVVLSWILSQTMASKIIFARNRLKDIIQTSRGLDSHYELRSHFMYVAITQNPVDLITRGLARKNFRFYLEFWLRNGIHLLPTQILLCLDTQSQLDCSICGELVGGPGGRTSPVHPFV